MSAAVSTNVIETNCPNWCDGEHKEADWYPDGATGTTLLHATWRGPWSVGQCENVDLDVTTWSEVAAKYEPVEIRSAEEEWETLVGAQDVQTLFIELSAGLA